MQKLTSMTLIIALLASPAAAHHPLAGAPMETFSQGLLSGIGHPVLGFDHLAFVVLVGIAAALSASARVAPLGYVAGMVFGCLALMSGLELPLVEVVIALSLLTVGAYILLGQKFTLQAAVIALGAFGLFHGAAFGESIVGQEAGYGWSVAVGYLFGLAAIQYLIAVGVAFVFRKNAEHTASIAPRLAASAVAGIGLFLILEQAESAAFSAIGIG